VKYVYTFARLFRFNLINGGIEDVLREALFPPAHNIIDEFSHERIVIFGIREYLPLDGSFPSGHMLMNKCL
jgi:membrane-associated phospholipid phosphatase